MAGSQCNKFRGDKGKGEGHMARQCTQPKRPRNAAWYKDKAMLAEAQEARQILDEEQLAFLADLVVPDGQVVQTIIPNNVAFQTEDLDTYDSDGDDISNAKVVLMADISNYGSNVISEFDSVVKKRTTPDACTEGEWGFEHTKAVFNNEIIPFLKSLKDIFNVFDKDLLNEIMEVQTDFYQMEAVVQQSLVDKQCLEIAKKELLLENDRLLQQIMSQDVLLTVMNSMSLIGKYVNMNRKRNESCDKCFNLDAELLKSQNVHNDLLKKFFENNDLKAQLQDKDTTICKLKEIIKSMREKSKEKNINYNYCEIETKNVELEHSVAKLLSENERLCKEINHVKQDLKAQIQDKVFVITSLKNDLRKLKGKEIVDIAAQIPSANTIVPGMFKIDLDPLAPRLLQNREAHIDYLKYTQKQADILRGIVEQAKAK
ncbi:hypothetical protein Tco_0796358 [Tanacetum coccineum]